MTIQRFSDLKIMFSNCTLDGSAWTSISDKIITQLRESLLSISNLEFRGINCNNVSGDHTSFTITIFDAFYELNNNVDINKMFDIEAMVANILRQIPNFHCSEIRVEHTRHRTTFKGLTHPQLAREL